MLFENKYICNPISIVCHACALMSYWAGVYSEGEKEALIAGVNTMMEITLKLVKKKPRTAPLLLQDKSDDAPGD